MIATQSCYHQSRTQSQTRGGDRGEQTLIRACSRAFPGSAMCVQNFDDSLNSAIRITYRISLRSSSLREPRYPLLKVVLHCMSCAEGTSCTAPTFRFRYTMVYGYWVHRVIDMTIETTIQSAEYDQLDRCGNDPSAGSPTETLLRL